MNKSPSSARYKLTWKVNLNRGGRIDGVHSVEGKSKKISSIFCRKNLTSKNASNIDIFY